MPSKVEGSQALSEKVPFEEQQAAQRSKTNDPNCRGESDLSPLPVGRGGSAYTWNEVLPTAYPALFLLAKDGKAQLLTWKQEEDGWELQWAGSGWRTMLCICVPGKWLWDVFKPGHLGHADDLID